MQNAPQTVVAVHACIHKVLSCTSKWVDSLNVSLIAMNNTGVWIHILTFGRKLIQRTSLCYIALFHQVRVFVADFNGSACFDI